MSRLTRLPYHRLPGDVHAPQRLAVGHHLLDRAQTVEEAEEVEAYLSAYVALVDAKQGDCRRTQVFRSRGQHN